MVSQRAIGTGLGFSSSGLSALTRHGEAEVVGHQRLHGQDAVHAALQVEQRPAAVARLDRDGELDHRPAVDLAPAGDDAGDDAVLQAVRVAQGDDRLARA